jgi:hypothetical protein
MALWRGGELTDGPRDIVATCVIIAVIGDALSAASSGVPLVCGQTEVRRGGRRRSRSTGRRGIPRKAWN